MSQAKGVQIGSPDSQLCWCLDSPHPWVSTESLLPGKAEQGCATSTPEASAGSWRVFLHHRPLMWTPTSAQRWGGDRAFLPPL